MTSGWDAEKFKLRVENVFYIKPIDRVIVTGSVSSGTDKPGDHLIVRSDSTAVSVTVERLEHPQLKLESASKGQPVGLVASWNSQGPSESRRSCRDTMTDRPNTALEPTAAPSHSCVGASHARNA